MNTTEIDGVTYRIGKLNAIQQFHIARRMAPVLAVLGESVGALVSLLPKPGQQVGDTELPDGVIPALASAAEVMAQMSDADSEYVIYTCLGVVARKQGEVYAPILGPQRQFMFSDIEMPAMLQLTFAVVKDNLGSFFPKGEGARNTSNA